MIRPTLASALLSSLAEEEKARVADFYEYLDLCNEQVFLRLQGRVRRRTWEEWSRGIKGNLEREPMSSAWESVRSGLPEFEELGLLSASRFSDPRLWNPLWRRVLRRELDVNDERVDSRAMQQ